MSKIELSPCTVRLWAALILMATFIVGAAAGAGLTHWMTPNRFPWSPPPPPPPMFGKIPIHELGLDQKQMAAFDEIMKKYRPELDGILKASFPKVRAVNDKIEAELSKVLTPEQQKRLDDINARRPRLSDGPAYGPPPMGGPGDQQGPGFGPAGGPPPMSGEQSRPPEKPPIAPNDNHQEFPDSPQ